MVFRIILYEYIDKLCDENCFGKKGLDRSFKPGTKNIEWISYFLDDIWYNLDEVKSICMSSCVLGCVCLYLQTNQRSKLSPLTDMRWYLINEGQRGQTFLLIWERTLSCNFLLLKKKFAFFCSAFIAADLLQFVK